MLPIAVLPGKRSGVIDQPIAARQERIGEGAARRIDIDRAAEGQIAVHLDQIIAGTADDVGHTQVVVHLTGRIERERPHGKQAPRTRARSRIQRGARSDGHRATERARSAERRARIGRHRRRSERAVDAQRPRRDRRRAQVGAGARQRECAAACLDQRARPADGARV